MWRLLVFFAAVVVAELNYSIIIQPGYVDFGVLYPWGDDVRPKCIERCGCGFCIRREGDPDWRNPPQPTSPLGFKFVRVFTPVCWIGEDDMFLFNGRHILPSAPMEVFNWWMSTEYPRVLDRCYCYNGRTCRECRGNNSVVLAPDFDDDDVDVFRLVVCYVNNSSVSLGRL